MEIRQTWKLSGDYFADYSAEINNCGAAAAVLKNIKVFSGFTSGIKNLCGDDVRLDFFTIEYYSADKKKLETFKIDDVKDKDFDESKMPGPIEWAGVSNKYFAMLLRAQGGFSGGGLPDREKISPENSKEDKDKFYIAGASGVIAETKIEPGETKKFDFKYFCGPKEVGELSKFAPEAEGVMYLSFLPLWFPGSSLMEMLAQWLLKGLIYLKSVSGSYGWAIILLTIIVRAAFWPVTQKANNSMKKMQKIQPMILKLRENTKTTRR